MAMPVPWQAGYRWAYDESDDKCDMGDEAEAQGYDFCSPDYMTFAKGVRAAQAEQGLNDPDDEDEDETP